MSIHYNPHIYVLPEDRANERIANGFVDNLKVRVRAIQFHPLADGWKKVLADLQETRARAAH
jgi:hypothetical protein